MTATPETGDVPFCEEHETWHENGLYPPACLEGHTPRLRANSGADPCPHCGCTGSVERALGETADARSDRSILLNIERTMTQVAEVVTVVAKDAGPVIQQIAGHGMFRMIFGKVKSDDDS